MRNTLKFAALGIAMLAASPAMAEKTEGNWLVRARAVWIDPANKSDPIPALGVPADAIHVSDKLIPELDVSYFFTKNLAAELILTYPQKHDVTVTSSAIGSFKAGNFTELPPTLTLQWHFNPEGNFRPYVGAGVNYTAITKVDLEVPGGPGLRLDSSSWGGAVQAGIDFKVSESLFFNIDVKKVQIRSDVKTDDGVKISHVKVDPLLIGIGLGYRF